MSDLISIELNTNVVAVLDAGQYCSMLQLPDETKITDENKKIWDEYVIEKAKPYLIDAIHLTNENITVDNFSYYHPQFYNFETDEINFTVTISKELLEKLFAEYQNNSEFIDFLKRYKSYDGFISYTAANKQEFIKQCKSEKENWRSLAQILTFNARDFLDKNQEYFVQDVIDWHMELDTKFDLDWDYIDWINDEGGNEND